MKRISAGLVIGRGAVTFLEVLVAFALLSVVLLPIYGFLTHSVNEVEHFYTEAVAISRAKFIMDTIMFQLPFRVLQENKPGELFCRFKDPENSIDASFLAEIVQGMFGKGAVTGSALVGDGVYTYPEGGGFEFRARVKIVDLDQDSYSVVNSIKFGMPPAFPGAKPVEFDIKDLTAKDSNGKYNLIKKIVLQVKWSDLKGVDPNKDRNARSIFLVGFKSDI